MRAEKDVRVPVSAGEAPMTDQQLIYEVPALLVPTQRRGRLSKQSVHSNSMLGVLHVKYCPSCAKFGCAQASLQDMQPPPSFPNADCLIQPHCFMKTALRPSGTFIDWRHHNRSRRLLYVGPCRRALCLWFSFASLTLHV